MINKHLWDVEQDHSIESPDAHIDWDSWEEFYQEFKNSNVFLNFLVSYSWQCMHKYNTQWKLTPMDRDYKNNDELMIHWVAGSKGFFFSSRVKINKSDEPKVIEFLKPRLLHLLKQWEPMLSNKDENDKDMVNIRIQQKEIVKTKTLENIPAGTLVESEDPHYKGLILLTLNKPYPVNKTLEDWVIAVDIKNGEPYYRNEYQDMLVTPLESNEEIVLYNEVE